MIGMQQLIMLLVTAVFDGSKVKGGLLNFSLISICLSLHPQEAQGLSMPPHPSDQFIVSHVIFFHSSQKQRRAALRKERRKRRRQALALARECGTKIAVMLVLLSSVINCCSCAISQNKHNIDSFTGLNNGEGYTPEDEEINDEDDEGDNIAELERWVNTNVTLLSCSCTFSDRQHRSLYCAIFINLHCD